MKSLCYVFTLSSLVFHFKQLWPEGGGSCPQPYYLDLHSERIDGGGEKGGDGETEWKARNEYRVLSNYAVWLKGSYAEPERSEPWEHFVEGWCHTGGGGGGGAQGGGDRPTFFLVLIIFCLPLIIQRPGVLPVMKTLNHKVYI